MFNRKTRSTKKHETHRLFPQRPFPATWLGAAALALALVGCGGGGGGGSTPAAAPGPVATNTVGGTLSGLLGSGLALQNNAADDLTLATNGSYSFATALPQGAAYSVSVKTQPRLPAQNCTVAAGTGAVGTAAVTSAAVTCGFFAPRFAYVANFSSDNVSAYSINASTGALAAVAGSPFASGSNPWSVTVDPSGRFAYVANSGSLNVSAYSINASTGVLTPFAPPTIAAGLAPRSIVVTR